MLRQRLIGCLIALASVGWLVPMWFGVDTYLHFLQAEAFALSIHADPPLASFPLLHFSARCFAVAFAWLGVVVSGWSYTVSVWLLAVLRPNNSFKPKPLRGSA